MPLRGTIAGGIVDCIQALADHTLYILHITLQRRVQMIL